MDSQKRMRMLENSIDVCEAKNVPEAQKTNTLLCAAITVLLSIDARLDEMPEALIYTERPEVH